MAARRSSSVRRERRGVVAWQEAPLRQFRYETLKRADKGLLQAFGRKGQRLLARAADAVDRPMA